MTRHQDMRPNNKEKLRKRARAEWRFRSYGILSLLFAGTALVFLVSTIVSSGHSAFFKTTIELEFQLDAERLGIETPYTRENLWAGSYYTAAKYALYALFPEVTSRPDKRALSKMLSPGAELELRDYVIAHPAEIGETVTLEVPVSSDYDQLYKGHLPRTGKHTRLSAQQMERFDRLVDEGYIHYRFNLGFLTGPDSRYPELAGIGGAIAGSFHALLVCFLLSFPLGIAAARVSRGILERYPPYPDDRGQYQ